MKLSAVEVLGTILVLVSILRILRILDVGLAQ